MIAMFMQIMLIMKSTFLVFVWDLINLDYLDHNNCMITLAAITINSFNCKMKLNLFHFRFQVCLKNKKLEKREKNQYLPFFILQNHGSREKKRAEINGKTDRERRQKEVKKHTTNKWKKTDKDQVIKWILIKKMQNKNT